MSNLQSDNEESEVISEDTEELSELAETSDESNAIYQHAVIFYGLLHDAANDEILSDNRVVRVFRGKVVEKFRELEISNSYYSSVRKVLIDTGCMHQVQQGARNSPTIMVLYHPPVASEVVAILSSNINLTAKIDLATLSQRVKDITEQIGPIRVTDALVGFEKRLQHLEKVTEELEKYVDKMKQPMPKMGTRENNN